MPEERRPGDIARAGDFSGWPGREEMTVIAYETARPAALRESRIGPLRLIHETGPVSGENAREWFRPEGISGQDDLR